MIKEALDQHISSTLQLREAILSYNSRFVKICILNHFFLSNLCDFIYEPNLFYSPRFYDDPSWSFQCLHEIVEDFNEAEKESFFTKILPGMIKLCLAGPEVKLQESYSW